MALKDIFGKFTATGDSDLHEYESNYSDVARIMREVETNQVSISRLSEVNAPVILTHTP